MASFWGHLRTVAAHRHQVFLNCVRAGIWWQGLWHDMSKFSPTEFWAGVKYYSDGTRSPNETERAVYGFSKAWMHHKGRNRHHFEYWTDYDPKTKVMSPAPMPDKYIVEMACDRIAASKIYMKENYNDTSALGYYERGKPTRSIHPETAQKIEYILTILAETGETAAFAYMRQMTSENINKKGKRT